MKRRLFRNLSRSFLLAIAALALAASSAVAAGPLEGGFENGLAAWTRKSFYKATEWKAQTRVAAEEEFERALPPGVLPAAIGPYVAATEYGGNDTTILAQTFALPAASKLNLSLYLFYESETPTLVPTPDTLFGEGDNQQVRVDVLRANAPLETVSPNDILATLYASPPDGPEVLGPTLLNADLSQFAGQTVTLRIAEATSAGEMKVGLGAVSLAATPLPPAPPAPVFAEEPPSTPISDGVASPVARKIVHHFSTGGALLGVRLPAAGSLVVSDARRKAAVASVFAARRTTATPKPILIRTASVAVDRAQTVHVPLRPTAAAERLLAKRGRVHFRLQLTFTSARGAVSTSTYKGVLVKRLRRARR